MALFLSKLLPAYFAKKGENLATREDIGGFMEIVESIKREHTLDINRQTTTLQTVLNRLSAQIAKLEDQGREALITVFDGAAQLAYDKPTTDSLPAEKNALKAAIRAAHSGFDTHFKQYSYDVNYNQGADIATRAVSSTSRPWPKP